MGFVLARVLVTSNRKKEKENKKIKSVINVTRNCRNRLINIKIYPLIFLLLFNIHLLYCQS